MSLKYDFSGWATRNDLVCADGRTIRHNAFEDCDGKTVPLVWNHQHDFILKKVAGLRLQLGKGEDHQSQIYLALHQLLL